MSTHYWQQNTPEHAQREEKPTPIVFVMAALTFAFLLMLTIFLISQ